MVSEDVFALATDVALVVQCGRVHHRLAARDSAPDVLNRAIVVLDGIFFHLFHVLLFGSSSTRTDALIVARVEGVALLEGSEERGLLHGSLLLGEGDVCAESREVRLERSSLANCVRPRLRADKNLRIPLAIVFSLQVLFPLIGLDRVAHFVEAREGLGLDSSGEARGALRSYTLGWAQRDVFEFRLANKLVATSHERLASRGASEASVVLARILVGVSESVTGELSECAL